MSAKLKLEMREERIRKAVARAARGALNSAAYVLAMRAKEKIKKRPKAIKLGPEPGTKKELQKRLKQLLKLEAQQKAMAAHKGLFTRRGQLPRAIVYAYDKTRMEAVIGPAASRVGTSASAHEHGGRYKGQTYPARPFMGPTLQENLDMIPQKFKGSIGP